MRNLFRCLYVYVQSKIWSSHSLPFYVFQTGGEFLAAEQKFLGLPPLNITFFPTYSQYCHDATWTLAYALNKTLDSEMMNNHNYLLYSCIIPVLCKLVGRA